LAATSNTKEGDLMAEVLPPEVQESAIEMPFSRDPTVIILSCLLIMAFLVACYFAAEIILPIVMAFILKLLLQPPMRFLERWHIPRSFAALFIVLALVAIVVAGVAALSGPATAWAQKIPESIPRIEERLKFLNGPISAFQTFLHQVDGGGSNSASGLDLSGILFRSTQNLASEILETLLVLFFLLRSGDTFLRRFVEILPTFRDKRQAVTLSQQIEANIAAYLSTISMMNALVGVATAIAMWACGLGDPFLWGGIAFALNYIPIMGPIVGMILFLFAGMLMIGAWFWALLPAMLYFLIHIVEGEVVTPLLLARRFTLNPVLVIISLIFWFWMWGAAGAILAVPMLAIAKIVCDGVKPLNALGHFLEG
jgi:predicted PurR-regulated permease PerM